MQTTIFRLGLMVFVLALVASLGQAQTTSGSMAGNVVDPQHAQVPNATVTATEENKKFTFTTNTDDAGRFVFAQAPPGVYTITVESTGFRKVEREHYLARE